MKIIYTQKKSSQHAKERLILAFECLLLVFVMCFFGTLLAKQRLDKLEDKYEDVISTQGEQIKDAIELIIPLQEDKNE